MIKLASLIAASFGLVLAISSASPTAQAAAPRSSSMSESLTIPAALQATVVNKHCQCTGDLYKFAMNPCVPSSCNAQCVHGHGGQVGWGGFCVP